MKLSFLAFFQVVGKYFAPKAALFFWYRHHKALFLFVFVIVLCIGGWKWYYGLYRYRFSDEEKRQYIEANFKETTFKESKFLDVVGRLTARARMHEEMLELKRDIFSDAQ